MSKTIVQHFIEEGEARGREEGPFRVQPASGLLSSSSAARFWFPLSLTGGCIC